MSLVVLSTITLGLTGCGTTIKPYSIQINDSSMTQHKKQQLLNKVVEHEFKKLYYSLKKQRVVKAKYQIVEGCIEGQYMNDLGLKMFRNCYKLDGNKVKRINSSQSLAKGDKEFRDITTYMSYEGKRYGEFIEMFQKKSNIKFHFNRILDDPSYLDDVGSINYHNYYGNGF